jgi:16S rRNA processing protein RimM
MIPMTRFIGIFVMAEYRNIGKFVATHGFKGDLLLEHHLGKKTALNGLKTLFLHLGDDNMFPYFVQHSKIKNENGVYIKVEGIDTKEAAEKILKKEVWISHADFKHFADDATPAALVGFHLVNDGTDLGAITEVIELPHQLLCKINLNNKEALIPLHDKTLKGIDKINRQVLVDLPDGLLDIYR